MSSTPPIFTIYLDDKEVLRSTKDFLAWTAYSSMVDYVKTKRGGVASIYVGNLLTPNLKLLKCISGKCWQDEEGGQVT